MNHRIAVCLALSVSVFACADVGEPDAPSAEDGTNTSELTTGVGLELRAEHSNLCLGIAGGSKNNGAALLQQACTGSPSQRFRVERSGDAFRLVNQNSGRCLDVAGASVERGAAIMQYTCHGGENQQWRVTEPSTNVLVMVAKHSGLALDIGGASRAEGAPAIQWNPTAGAANQRFRTSVPGTPGTGSGSCTTPPAPSPLVGWAAVSGDSIPTTTGGGTVAPQQATTLAKLQELVAGDTPRVVHVTGKLAAGKITVGSNKTIIGLCGAEVRGSVSLKGSKNVILRNLKFVGYGAGNCALDPDFDSSVGCSSGNDAVELQGANHVWVDHCDISNGTDGNLDVNNGSNYVTVSWTKFSYAARTDNQGNDSTGAAGHRFSSLIGGSDNKTTDRGKLNITWHHNWWADSVVERQARVRFGKNHFFNNLWSSTASNYCVRAGKEASLHLENNVFSGVKDAHEFNSSSDKGTAYISAVGNSYESTTGVRETGGSGRSFTPSAYYSYSATTASQVRAAVTAGAGPR